MADEILKDSSSGFVRPEKSKFPTHVSKLKHKDKKSSSAASQYIKIPLPHGQESRVMRFLNKVNNYINEILSKTSPSPQSEKINLSGRIHQFREDIDKTVHHLHSLHDELEKEGQFQFSFLITSVIDPLIKEINRLEKSDNLSTVVQQVRESNEFVAWTEKAKKWIDLCSKRHTHLEDINQAFIDHIFQEFRARIDKDLRVIQDYANSFMDKLNEDDAVKSDLKVQLEHELSKHIFKLYLLKDNIPENCMESLNDWRVEADLKREKCFSDALHAIDTNIGEIMQPTIIEETIDESIMNIQERLTSLEENIVQFYAKLQRFANDGDEELKKICLTDLTKMENEAHSLNSNLQLTHEHVERVIEVIDTLAHFRNKLQ